MCVFYFPSKHALKVSTHITNGTVIINNMHCVYIAEMYTIPFESYYKFCIHFCYIHTVHVTVPLVMCVLTFKVSLLCKLCTHMTNGIRLPVTEWRTTL